MRKEKIGAFVLPSLFGCIYFSHFDYNNQEVTIITVT